VTKPAVLHIVEQNQVAKLASSYKTEFGRPAASDFGPPASAVPSEMRMKEY